MPAKRLVFSLMNLGSILGASRLSVGEWNHSEFRSNRARSAFRSVYQPHQPVYHVGLRISIEDP